MSRPAEQPPDSSTRSSRPPEFVIHRDPDLLAEAVAARLITRLVDVQATRTTASVVLTGGRVGIATLAAIASSPARGAVDWAGLDVWWGDERFLPAGDPDRNETQAQDALLNHVPVDEARVHAMAAADGAWADDPEAAAQHYADELAAAAAPRTHSGRPVFDVLLLGVGPDAHVASLFPEKPALYEEERTVVAVRAAPKPPPTRISLTLPAIQSADEVWLVVAGADKSNAVRMALSGAGPLQVPAAGARGRRRTLWLLDEAAANALQPDRLASSRERRASP